MTRTYLDQTIQRLKDEILVIEKLVSNATIKAVTALIQKDLKKSSRGLSQRSIN